MRLSYYLNPHRLQRVDPWLEHMYICVASIILNCFPDHYNPGRSDKSLIGSKERVQWKDQGINKGYS